MSADRGESASPSASDWRDDANETPTLQPTPSWALAIAACAALPALAAPGDAPQFYSGYIEDAGVPVEGTAAVTLRIWDDATATDVANLVCETIDSTAPVIGGRFSIALDPTCETMGAREELHLEVDVDGVVLPRVRVGKLPYAAAAQVANEAAGPLATRITNAEETANQAMSQASNALTFGDLGFELEKQCLQLERRQHHRWRTHSSRPRRHPVCPG